MKALQQDNETMTLSETYQEAIVERQAALILQDQAREALEQTLVKARPAIAALELEPPWRLRGVVQDRDFEPVRAVLERSEGRRPSLFNSFSGQHIAKKAPASAIHFVANDR